jgi:hypothetical protein
LFLQGFVGSIWFEFLVYSLGSNFRVGWERL